MKTDRTKMQECKSDSDFNIFGWLPAMELIKESNKLLRKKRAGIKRKNRKIHQITLNKLMKIPPRMFLVVQHSISAYNTRMLINTEIHGSRMFEE